MRRMGFLVLTAMALVLMANVASASIMYQYDNDSYDHSDSTNPGSWYANIFTAAQPTGFVLDKVWVYNLNSPYTMELNVWEVDGGTGLPSTALATWTKTVSSGGWNIFDVPWPGTAPHFALGTKFAIGFKQANDEIAPYAPFDDEDGSFVASYWNRWGRKGWTENASAVGDLMVRGEGHAAPEPVTLALIGVAGGIGGLMRMRRRSTK